MSLENELQLLKQAIYDPQSFGKLYDYYYPKIFNYILRSTFDIHKTQDITSETFLKVLQNLKKFKITDTGSFQAWIYKIATNEINQYYRKTNKYQFHPDEEMDTYYSEQIPEEEITNALEQMDKMKEIKVLQEAINKLDQKYKNILFLKYFENKKFNEIAKITGIKEGTLKSHLSRAVAKLRDVLSNDPNFKDYKAVVDLIIIIAVIIYFGS